MNEDRERQISLRRAYELAGYALYEAARERRNPIFDIGEIRAALDKSIYTSSFPRGIKLIDLINYFLRRKIIECVEYNGKIVGIEVLACPFIPPEALLEGEEQQDWFSGKTRQDILEEFLKQFKK